LLVLALLIGGSWGSLVAAAALGYFALGTLALVVRLYSGFVADSITGLYGGDTLIEEGERI